MARAVALSSLVLVAAPGLFGKLRAIEHSGAGPCLKNGADNPRSHGRCASGALGVVTQGKGFDDGRREAILPDDGDRLSQ